MLVPVPASIAAYEAAFARSGHRDHRIVVFPGADHRIMVPDPVGGGRRRAPGLFELTTSWLADRLGEVPADPQPADRRVASGRT